MIFSTLLKNLVSKLCPSFRGQAFSYPGPPVAALFLEVSVVPRPAPLRGLPPRNCLYRLGAMHSAPFNLKFLARRLFRSGRDFRNRLGNGFCSNFSDRSFNCRLGNCFRRFRYRRNFGWSFNCRFHYRCCFGNRLNRRFDCRRCDFRRLFRDRFDFGRNRSRSPHQQTFPSRRPGSTPPPDRGRLR